MTAGGSVPVIAIDGPSASGKGTVAKAVAESLRFHYLDSGALYRLVALAASRAGVDPDRAAAVAALARSLEVTFMGDNIFMKNDNVTDQIRSEACSRDASRVAVLPEVRAALLERQRAFRRPPGLVADGRDMGTQVFPDAVLKVFLTASAEERAQRRYKQLKDKGMNASIGTLLQDIVERDRRDSERSAAPLQKAADARFLDTTSLTIDQAVAAVVRMYREIPA